MEPPPPAPPGRAPALRRSASRRRCLHGGAHAPGTAAGLGRSRGSAARVCCSVQPALSRPSTHLRTSVEIGDTRLRMWVATTGASVGRARARPASFPPSVSAGDTLLMCCGGDPSASPVDVCSAIMARGNAVLRSRSRSGCTAGSTPGYRFPAGCGIARRWAGSNAATEANCWDQWGCVLCLRFVLNDLLAGTQIRRSAQAGRG